MSLLERVASVWSSLETITYAAVATSLFIGLFVVLPYTLVRDLYHVRPVPALAVVAVCVLTIAALIRDVAMRRFSFVGKAVLGLWLVCLLFVIIAS